VKKIKKSLGIFLIIIMSLTMLISCGEPEIKPEESAKIYLDLILKGDKIGVDKIGIGNEEYIKFTQEFEKGILQGIEKSGLDEKILTDQVKLGLKNDFVKGLSKIEYKIISTSNDSETATVNVEIKGFDMNKIVKTSSEKLDEKILNSNSEMSKVDIYQESLKLIGQGIANGILTDKQQNIILKFTNNDGKWVPSEENIKIVMEAISKE
jgi:hypothetical protein